MLGIPPALPHPSLCVTLSLSLAAQVSERRLGGGGASLYRRGVRRARRAHGRRARWPCEDGRCDTPPPSPSHVCLRARARVCVCARARVADSVSLHALVTAGFTPPAADAPHAIDVDQVHIYDKTCLEFLRHPKLEVCSPLPPPPPRPPLSLPRSSPSSLVRPLLLCVSRCTQAPLRDCLANDIWGVSHGEPEGIKSHYWCAICTLITSSVI